MKVLKRNVLVHFDRNKHFNDEAEGLVTGIFQHQDIGSTGYIAARTSTPYAPAKSDDQKETEVDVDAPGNRLVGFDVSGLGEYERRVFLRVVSGKYCTTVLTGDMGSGKSTTIDCITAALKRPRANACGVCRICNPVVIKLNFNAGYEESNMNSLVAEFREDLYDQLAQELHRIFTEACLPDAFRKRVIHGKKTGDTTYAAFNAFVQSHKDELLWTKYPDDQKADLLFDYVDERTAKGTKSLTILMKLIFFAKQYLKADRGCFVLFFDNIDSVAAEAQFAILAEILKYQVTAQVQALVTLRRSNFATFGQNLAATTFAPIDHIGPDIKEVIVKRLEYYAKNWNSLTEVQEVQNPTYRQAVKTRLDYLLGTKDEPRGAIQRVSSICGSSIRLGLYMSERFFLNSAVPFDEEPRFKDDLVRGVLVGNSRSNEIQPDDDCVVNLLLNKRTGEASLLNVRILQLIAELEHDKANRTIRHLSEVLKALDKWSKEDVRDALNYLLNVKKPLLWVDGKVKYDPKMMINHGDDVVYMTEAAFFYQRVLLLDLVYVQEAALSVKWSASHIPSTVNYADVIERFEVLRCFLDELARQDYNQTIDLLPWLAKNRTRVSITPNLFVNRMIAALGKSVLNILLDRIKSVKHDVDEQMRLRALDELRDWRSMINIWLGTEKDLLGTCSKRLESVSKEYRDRLPRN